MKNRLFEGPLPKGSTIGTPPYSRPPGSGWSGSREGRGLGGRSRAGSGARGS